MFAQPFHHARHGLVRLLRRMHLRVLLGGLLGMLLGDMPPDDATADRTHHRVVSCIVSGHAAHHRAFETSRGIRGANGCQRQRDAQQYNLGSISFHT